MTAKQISVFLENKPGQLSEFTKLLNENNINMCALSLADAEDFGILRIIVDDMHKTACVLKESGYVFSITPVLAVEMSNKPGSLMKILEILGENQINLEYSYSFTIKKADKAYMIFRVNDTDGAAKILTQNGVKLICQHELAELV
ncbi:MULTISPECIES: ACT domain-containing protein [Clostridiaceae]|uniref:Acetolactate synthase n=1 Tax=Clostridium facile TaxID=2763035 RepID=A0ABR7IN15_9CLOT|nr:MULTISPECIES: ACT domain-containing protein [Clostridiaceae]MBC5786483.1 acetolactate synthase [Clostridium facile]PWN00099.1 MAG: acetolactate synthase [Massilioclostridium sp.]PWN00619.1 MAG: acetolactate synthase [Massilioclostridium sp.]